MKDRQQKQGGNRPNKRDNDPTRRSDPERRTDDRSGTESERRGGMQEPQRKGGSEPEEQRGMRGDDINRQSEPRRPFDETNIGDDDEELTR